MLVLLFACAVSRIKKLAQKKANVASAIIGPDVSSEVSGILGLP